MYVTHHYHTSCSILLVFLEFPFLCKILCIQNNIAVDSTSFNDIKEAEDGTRVILSVEEIKAIKEAILSFTCH